MARYATYIRASTDDQETTHQRAAIDDWLAEHAVDAGESYRSVARDVPNLARTTLMSIHKDNDRHQWYLGAEAEDKRVAAALNPIEQ